MGTLPQNVFTIFTGDEKTMNLKALFAGSLSPLDLTSCTEIEVNLPGQTGVPVSLTLSGDEVTITSPSLLGKFAASISSDNSLLLNIGEFQDFNVGFTILGVKTTVRYYGVLSVFES